MEIRLRRGIPGCVYWALALMSLGLVPLAMSMGEGLFIRRMGDNGVETRSGKRIPWAEFTKIEHVQGVMGRGVLSDEYVLSSRQGRVSLPLWRTENAAEARDYLLARIPPSLLEPRES